MNFIEDFAFNCFITNFLHSISSMLYKHNRVH